MQHVDAGVASTAPPVTERCTTRRERRSGCAAHCHSHDNDRPLPQLSDRTCCLLQAPVSHARRRGAATTQQTLATASPTTALHRALNRCCPSCVDTCALFRGPMRLCHSPCSWAHALRCGAQRLPLRASWRRHLSSLHGSGARQRSRQTLAALSATPWPCTPGPITLLPLLRGQVTMCGEGHPHRVRPAMTLTSPATAARRRLTTGRRARRAPLRQVRALMLTVCLLCVWLQLSSSA